MAIGPRAGARTPASPVLLVLPVPLVSPGRSDMRRARAPGQPRTPARWAMAQVETVSLAGTLARARVCPGRLATWPAWARGRVGRPAIQAPASARAPAGQLPMARAPTGLRAMAQAAVGHRAMAQVPVGQRAMAQVPEYRPAVALPRVRIKARERSRVRAGRPVIWQPWACRRPQRCRVWAAVPPGALIQPGTLVQRRTSPRPRTPARPRTSAWSQTPAPRESSGRPGTLAQRGTPARVRTPAWPGPTVPGAAQVTRTGGLAMPAPSPGLG